MKPSYTLRYTLLCLSCLTSTIQAEILIPGGGGPHANKDYIFNGKVHEWAHELHNYSDGQAVIFESAGEVKILGSVVPKTVTVTGDGESTLMGMGHISGDTTLTKEGIGKLTLNSINLYTGDTILREGQMIAGGDASFGSGAIIAEGGTLFLNGYAVSNDIYLRGAQLEKASDFTGRLFAETDVQLNSDTNARELIITPGKSVSVADKAQLSTQETLKLFDQQTLDLSSGADFNSNIHVRDSGILRLATDGSASIAPGCTWHLENAQVSGSLSTARQTAARALARTTDSNTILRISGNSSISGALTLSGGTLQLSSTQASLRVGTLVLSKPTMLQHDAAPDIGQSHTFLRYNRLLSGDVTDYYDFFGVDAEEYALDITTGSITITTRVPQPPTPTPSPTPDSPNLPENEEPAPIVPTPGPEQNTPTPETPDNDGPHDSKDPGPIIDTSGDTENDPHNNKGENNTDNNGEGSAPGSGLSPAIGSALSQAGMQSAWGAALAGDIFMQAVYDESRSGSASTWFAFMGGVLETDNDQALPGADAHAYGIAVGASAAAGASTRLGLALGGSLGTISGDSFGELDQTTVQAAIYMHHAFLPTTSPNSLNLYLALGCGRTETDPGSYSGIESWHHNSFIANTRLSWNHQLTDKWSWQLYGGLDYYRTGDINPAEEEISGLTYGRGRLGTGIVRHAGDTTLYAELEFNGDILRDDPTATFRGQEFQTAHPDRCGFALHAGMLLTPEKSDRTIGLHYSYETRGNASAHIISMSFDHVF